MNSFFIGKFEGSTSKSKDQKAPKASSPSPTRKTSPRSKRWRKKNLQHPYFHKAIVSLTLNLSSLFLLFSSLYAHQVKSYIFTYGGCSQEKYQPKTPFDANLKSLLSSIVSSASQSTFNSFDTGNGTSAPPDAAVYGLYQCRGDLKTTECAGCTQNAVTQITLLCPYCRGASLQLDGCFVRYESFDFLGKQDTNLTHKKCSGSTSSDVEFFKRRDDVIADLETATGFRVSSLGLVEGVAQCLGDLSSADCSSCLSEAVAKLKNLCGSAAAADVYLAKCYAKYWASGYYDSSSDSSSDDEVGKSVAIIVGVLAGLAIVVVLLSFLRKAMGRTQEG
ncbi:plasmodesmata-located protein 8-like [Telopea speciosissima]|uniref:plasmodesmata-located protein 8-like n=1 Tax=Telopea speciosissima TaxID=54955 RepID=UPI001CC79D52|nr:plasmodesmata-located protein 8-like [Telopea speciosissima]